MSGQLAQRDQRGAHSGRCDGAWGKGLEGMVKSYLGSARGGSKRKGCAGGDEQSAEVTGGAEEEAGVCLVWGVLQVTLGTTCCRLILGRACSGAGMWHITGTSRRPSCKRAGAGGAWRALLAPWLGGMAVRPSWGAWRSETSCLVPSPCMRRLSITVLCMFSSWW